MEEDDVICDDGAQIDCAPTFRSHGPIRYTTCNIDSFAFLQIIVDSVSQFRPKNSDSMPLRFLGDLTCTVSVTGVCGELESHDRVLFTASFLRFSTYTTEQSNFIDWLFHIRSNWTAERAHELVSKTGSPLWDEVIHRLTEHIQRWKEVPWPKMHVKWERSSENSAR